MITPWKTAEQEDMVPETKMTRSSMVPAAMRAWLWAESIPMIFSVMSTVPPRTAEAPADAADAASPAAVPAALPADPAAFPAAAACPAAVPALRPIFMAAYSCLIAFFWKKRDRT